MKTSRFLVIALMTISMTFGMSTMALAGKNADMRVAYVLKNLGIKRDLQVKLKPILDSYMADKKAANKVYDNLKDKLKPSIEAGTITDKQAQALLDAKWVAAEKELAVKKEYEKKFKTVLSAKKTYLCFDLLNDKKSKVRGEKSADNDD
jgi:hypothetical protein